MARILFIASHRPDRAPGQRFRFEQYFHHLEQNGHQCELSFLVGQQDDRVLYTRGNYLGKARFVRRAIRKRSADLARVNDFDIVFIFREALMTRSIRFEEGFKRSRAKLVFDFDDAIWLPNVSEANRAWAWMKDPGKTSRIIAMCDLVFAGNAYLAEYARAFNKRVEVVPTTIDTGEYVPRTARPDGPVIIGWSGSVTTIQHFRYAVPALQKLKAKYGDRIAFRVVGDGTFRHEELGITGLPWRKDTELDDLRAMDIGIMPLPDDEWARGKCGLKGLQYMALGIPTLMSPVGVNTEIIHHGVNGFLPRNDNEWVELISCLVEDADLRARLGAEARRTVEQRFSVLAWRDTYLNLFNSLIHQPQVKRA
ncbi:MAG: glycosyltransferase family 4 protein [Flavobacteriales bacterium]|nr:glycosyltransferase family 4 protein [Flavobacteriales bacterium]